MNQTSTHQSPQAVTAPQPSPKPLTIALLKQFARAYVAPCPSVERELPGIVLN